MRLSLMLPPYPTERWALATQMGVTAAVSALPREERGERPWDYVPLLHMKQRFQDFGLDLVVIEASPPLDGARLGLPGRDQEIENFCLLLRNMGALGIPVLCWNWMARLGWLRTSTTTPARGGALVTSYDHQLMQDAPLTEAGRVSEELLWDSLAYFLERAVPAAEAADVRMAVHPDDPPVTSIRGISRILRTADAIDRATELVASPYHGVTFCQGTFAEMGADVPDTIRRFGVAGKIHFVHLRDIRGTAESFVETFVDDGQTDMIEAMRAYREIGFDGPARLDHVPTMAGEANENPGYETLGGLFAIGYLKGLLDCVGGPQAGDSRRG